MLGGEAVKPDAVLFQMRVDGKGDHLAHRRQRGKLPRAERHLVADAAHVDDRRRERDRVDRAGELADHDAALSARTMAASNLVQLRAWACVMAMASASAASALSGAASGSKHFTMARIWVLSP